MTARLPRVALLVLVVGLALHNLAMALLWQAGVRDTALDVVAAWKEALLLVALVGALAVAGSIPHLLWADRLALAYGVIVVVYLLVPQGWLDGEATARGELYALRHHLLPLGAYALGRLLLLDRVWWRRLLIAIVGVAAALAVWGLVDVYAVPLQWWRDSGAPGWFGEQLGLAYRCLSGLPENWILNTDEESPVRRLVSTFLSPLASAYLLLVAVLLLAAARPRRWTIAVGALVFVGLLWTHTRAAFIALPVALLVLAALRRSWASVALAAGSVAASASLVAVFPSIGPETTYTATELACLRDNAAVEGEASDDPSAPRRAPRRATCGRCATGSRRSRGIPGATGSATPGSRRRAPGRSSRRASRSTPSSASTRACSASPPRRLARGTGAGAAGRSPWLCASVVAVAILGLQTDVIGIHWLAVVVFALAGAALRSPPEAEPPERLL